MTATPDTVHARRGGVDEVHARVLAVRGLGERADVPEHLAERVRVQAHDLRHRVHALRDRPHVVDGHRADAAQRLGDDEVGPQRAQARLVELVDRASLLGERADGGVDLGRREAGADYVARDLG